MREHVNRLHFLYGILGVEQCKVACLCGRVAAHIDYALRLRAEYCVYHVAVHSCAWRVGDYHVGTSVACYEFVGKDVLHVAGVEQSILNSVDRRVHLGVLDCLRNIFDAYHFACAACHEVGYGARSCVEVP